ncbi:colicin-like pore-forming protein [Edwardsiella tarda]|uniref:Colicin-like pore-forming protein n=1 Tax=Edwardsiella tarda ATCC 15947 = NBRC 105688 TaxID=667121 RepID=A0AC61TN61_EDWTA|nr:colicin-like pore-forming protein [Edwardsiella tarda]UAL58228.1 hypothetical protein K8O98_17595 [Edwardsiella tarda]UCQ02065.1 colicin-like pore-forming protein [Edwardsiella tarda ATCC 15947 = NBRC 105688]
MSGGSGNGGDNAHANAFGGGRNPGMSNSNSGGSNSSSGRGGNSSGRDKGERWSMSNHPEKPVHKNEKGESVITVVNGWTKEPVDDKYNGGNGGNGSGHTTPFNPVDHHPEITHAQADVTAKISAETVANKALSQALSVKKEAEIGLSVKVSAIDELSRRLLFDEANVVAKQAEINFLEAKSKRLSAEIHLLELEKSRDNRQFGLVISINAKLRDKQQELNNVNAQLNAKKSELPSLKVARDKSKNGLSVAMRGVDQNLIKAELEFGKAKEKLDKLTSMKNEVERDIKNKKELRKDLQRLFDKASNDARGGDALRRFSGKARMDFYRERLLQVDTELTKLSSQLPHLHTDIESASLLYNKALSDFERAKADALTKKTEEDKVKDAVKFTADFYSEVFDKFGVKAKNLAQELANSSKGKKIDNIQEALDAYDKYKSKLGAMFSVVDRQAISNAMASVTYDDFAKNLSKFSKVSTLTSYAIDGYELYGEIRKAIETDNWTKAIVKAETIFAGVLSTSFVTYMFASIAITPLGIIGFASLIAFTSLIVDEKLINNINSILQ